MQFTTPLAFSGKLASLAFLLLGLHPSAVNSVTFDCKQVVIGEVKLDLSPLTGPHSVSMLQRTPTAIKNTTFTIDICKPLYKSGDKPKSAECPNGSRVCALERFYHPEVVDEPIPEDVWPISGEFLHEGRGRELNPQYTRLRNSASNADADREGLRLELNGGIHEGMKQKTTVEFICDHDKTGLEGMNDEKTSEHTKRQEGEEPAPEPPLPDPNAGKSLQLKSYRVESTGASGGNDEEVGVLRLEWRTKYACERSAAGGDKSDEEAGGDTKTKTGGWGFFTWFIVILFLLVAAYLIFGSWLNYSRHGARGWDLLPHGDAIRDLPYLMKDWARRVVSTVQGGGGRGYSAI